MSYLRNLVKLKVVELGDDKAAEFFGVSKLLVQQWRNGSKTPSLQAIERVFEEPKTQGLTERANWEGKKVVLLLPWYRSAHPLTTFSLLGMLEKDKMGALLRFNDAFIAHSRNTLADQFVDSGVEWGMSIDDDLICPWGNAAWFNHYTGFNFPDKYAGKHLINSLLSHGKTYVGALYFGRNAKGRGMYHEACITGPAADLENAKIHRGPVDELRATEWVATGALLTHRSVFLDIRKTFPHLAPQHPSEPWHYYTNANDAIVNKMFALSDDIARAHQFVRDGKMDLSEVEKLLEDTRVQLEEVKMHNLRDSRLQMGEDQVLGRRAKLAGHQPYVDLSVVCAHVGNVAYGPFNTKP